MSSTGSGSMVTPADTDVRIPDFSPNMWKYGFTCRYRSPGTRPVIAIQSIATASVRLCVDTTPLGTPVVPDVKRMSDRSSGVTADARRSTSVRPRSRARSRKPPQSSVPSGGVPLATTIVCRSGRSTSASRSIAT